MKVVNIELINNFTFLFSISFHLQFPHSLPDIPEDAPILNLNKMVNLDTSKLQTETTGEKIVLKLQEYLLSKMSPDE